MCRQMGVGKARIGGAGPAVTHRQWGAAGRLLRCSTRYVRLCVALCHQHIIGRPAWSVSRAMHGKVVSSICCIVCTGPLTHMQVLVLVGFFTLLNAKNQGVLMWGRPPDCVLHRLSAVPNAYLTRPDLAHVSDAQTRSLSRTFRMHATPQLGVRTTHTSLQCAKWTRGVLLAACRYCWALCSPRHMRTHDCGVLWRRGYRTAPL